MKNDPVAVQQHRGEWIYIRSEYERHLYVVGCLPVGRGGSWRHPTGGIRLRGYSLGSSRSSLGSRAHRGGAASGYIRSIRSLLYILPADTLPNREGGKDCPPD